jgi:hypothetical protein
MRKGLGRHNYRSAGGPVPSLVLDFAGTGTLDSRITFTRASNATYYNSSGVLTTASNDVARFDYNPSTLAPLGLLIEQSSTNLLSYSEDFTNAAWVKTATLGGTTTAPDGSSNGRLIYPLTTGTFRVLYQVVNGLTLGIYTWTLYAKAQNKNFLFINPPGDGTTNIYFNLSTNQVGTIASGYTASIQDVGNGWRRCVVTNNANTAYTFGAVFGVCDANGSTTATANGTDGIYVFGSDIEKLAFPTSYIKTTTAAATRASDNASMTGTNFSSWYNQNQGTMFVDFTISSRNDTPPYRGAYSLAIAICRLDVLKTTSGLPPSATRSIAVGRNKEVASYNSANQTITEYINGVNTATLTSVTSIINPASSLAIGRDDNFSALSGTISKLTYYPTPLTNAQLQALTT